MQTMLNSEYFDFHSFSSNKRLCKSWPITEPTSVLDSRTPSPTSTASPSSLPISDLLSEVMSQGCGLEPTNLLPVNNIYGSQWCEWNAVGDGNDGLLEDVAGISVSTEGSLASALNNNCIFIPSSPVLTSTLPTKEPDFLMELPATSDEDESFIRWLLAQGSSVASSTNNEIFHLPNCTIRQSTEQQLSQTPAFPFSPIAASWQAHGAILPAGLLTWQQSLPEHEKLSRWMGSNDGQLSVAMDQLSLFIEALELTNSDLTQAILARLNLLLPSPHVGNPLQRSVFYFKEALAAESSSAHNQSPNLNACLLSPTLHNKSSVHNQSPRIHRNPNACLISSTLDVLQKIIASKDYSKSSPLPTFAHFTCNQAILEALDVQSNIHIIDFDPGLGGQWSSFLQDLALRTTPIHKLHMTLVGSNFLEMQSTQENLSRFASGLCLPLQITTVSISNCVDYLTEFMLEANESGEEQALAINFGNGGYQLYSEFSTTPSLLAFLRFIRGLSPRVVTVTEEEVEVIEGNNNSTPLCQYLLERLKQYAFVLDSLEPSSVAAMKKMEQYVVEPQIRAIVEATLRRSRSGVDLLTQNWPNLLRKVGFIKQSVSVNAEFQAEIVLKGFNNHKGGGGFSIGNDKGTIILSWKGRHLAAASAWTCHY